MRWGFIFRVISLLIIFLCLSMIIPLIWAIYYQEKLFPIVFAMIITAVFGLSLYLFFKNASADTITRREAMATVTFGWTSVCIFGALPFYFCPEFGSFTDAFFESISGFTTTGASILNNIESVPKGLLFWRSFIQWLGGMGIILLSLAVLPFLKVGGMQLYRAEVPGPVPDKLKPRIKETAMIMWKVYLIFSAVQVVLLMMGNMSFYDSLCHAFATMPTGGFSTKNASIAQFNSTYFDCIIIFFMLMAGINFSLHYKLFSGKPFIFMQDTECRFFLGAVFFMTILTAFDIWKDVYASFGQALRYAAFQVVSIVTTTGFATADYNGWPALSKIIIFLCMFLGASAGSTGGAIKCVRVVLCIKYCYRELFAIIHPHSVSHIKLGGKIVPDDVMHSVLGFLMLYIGIFILCSIALAKTGVDFMTSVSAVAASLGNIGPGFALVGPAGNFAHIPFVGKWLLIWCMLLGRLELFTVIILMVPEFWRK